MPRISNTQAYVVACTGGAILWQATALLTGRREAWDSDAYLSVSYPLGILLTGALGYLNPVRPWRWGLALTLIQPVVMVVQSGSDYSLLPLGLIMFAFLAVLPVAAAVVIGAIRRRRSRKSA